MGYILIANYPCGYKSDKLYFGSGILRSKKIKSMPALRNFISDIEMQNQNIPNNFDKFIFYSENVMHEDKKNACKWECENSFFYGNDNL